MAFWSSVAARMFEIRRNALLSASRGLGRPEDVLGAAGQRLDRAADRLRSGLRALLDGALTHVAKIGGRLNKNLLAAGFAKHDNRIAVAWARIAERTDRAVADRRTRLGASGRVLSAVSYQNVLERGFALVRGEDGTLLRRASESAGVNGGEIQFSDGAREFRFDGAAPGKPKKKSAPASKKATRIQSKPRQKGLFD